MDALYFFYKISENVIWGIPVPMHNMLVILVRNYNETQRSKGSYTKHVATNRGRGVPQNTTTLHNSYLENWLR